MNYKEMDKIIESNPDISNDEIQSLYEQMPFQEERQKIYEVVDFDMFYHPEPPYEAKSVDELTDTLSKLVPDIDVNIVREEADYWLDYYIKTTPLFMKHRWGEKR